MATDARGQVSDDIVYVRHMLGELRTLAEGEGCDMLRYLIEMAYVEAGDIQLDRRQSKIGRDKRDGAPDLAS